MSRAVQQILCSRERFVLHTANHVFTEGRGQFLCHHILTSSPCGCRAVGQTDVYRSGIRHSSMSLWLPHHLRGQDFAFLSLCNLVCKHRKSPFRGHCWFRTLNPNSSSALQRFFVIRNKIASAERLRRKPLTSNQQNSQVLRFSGARE